MTVTPKPRPPGAASLWTMTAPLGMPPLGEAKLDLSISKTQIQRALADVKSRTEAFSGAVSERVWQATVR